MSVFSFIPWDYNWDSDPNNVYRPYVEPTPDEVLLSAGIAAAIESIHHGTDFLLHLNRSDAQMVDAAVRAAWKVWKEGLEAITSD